MPTLKEETLDMREVILAMNKPSKLYSQNQKRVTGIMPIT
jgi:hypothetical protein